MSTLVVGISGASGAIYGIRLLEVLASMEEVTTHLVVTGPAEDTIAVEGDRPLAEVQALADAVHHVDDLMAPLASGFFPADGMVVAPCSARTLAAVAHSAGDNLLTRAADVTLKERRRLVLLFRETPLTLAHIRNMESVTLMGGIVLPPVPAFYTHPRTLADLVDDTLGRVLDLLGVPHRLGRRWQGPPGGAVMEYQASRGAHSLQAQVLRLGEDLVVLLGGGDRPHAGTTVVAEPRPSRADQARRSATSSVWNRLGHQDEALARPLAEALAAALDVAVVVVAGVHVEGLGPEGIQTFRELATELTRTMLHDLAGSPRPAPPPAGC